MPNASERPKGNEALPRVSDAERQSGEGTARVAGEGTARVAGGVAAREGSGSRRVTIDREGPLLIEGPVEVVMEDGTVAVSDRFVVAVCTCRRSRSYPWCDTSHRRHARPARRPRGKEARRDDDR